MNIAADAAAACDTSDVDDDNIVVDEDLQRVKLAKNALVSLSIDSSEDDLIVKEYCDRIETLINLGDGETLYELGVSLDDASQKGLTKEELEISEHKHVELTKRINATSTNIVTRQNGNSFTNIHLIRKNIEQNDFMEVRVAVVGNVDAGKSTLLGVLTHNLLDDGRGLAREKLFRHKHEFESGRTSSVGNDILGFGCGDEIINQPDAHSGHLDWASICRKSAKVVTFIDLAGHEKYLKTTIFGMTGHVPDYTMLMVGSNAGIIGMTKEHLSLALCLSVPVFIVVTKIDMCPDQVLMETMKNIDRMMKSPGVRKLPVTVRTLDDVVYAVMNFAGGKVCPIFQVSNVLGTNLDLLRIFLNLIPLRRKFSVDDPAEFQIDDVYWVDGVGTVVSGTCIAGTISLNDVLMFGPNSSGEFVPVPVRSIHRKRMPVSKIRCGQTASFAIRKFNKRDVRKGMVMISQKLNLCSTIQFEAEILILHHPTTIAQNYQAMVHIGSVRQTATIIEMTKNVLRTGDRDLVTFKFIRNPEYLRVGSRLVFREGRTKAVGTVTKIYPYTVTTQAKQARKKQGKLKDNWPTKSIKTAHS